MSKPKLVLCQPKKGDGWGASRKSFLMVFNKGSDIIARFVARNGFRM